MKNTILFLPLLLLFSWHHSALAQCTTDAGTLQPGDFASCLTGLVSAQAPQFNEDATLETDDLIKWVIHDGTPTELGTQFWFYNIGAVSFPPPPDIVPGQVYQVSLIAGNDDGMGGIDLSDPCLSVSGGATVAWYLAPEVNAEDGFLDCDEFGEEIFIDIDPPAGNYSIEVVPFPGQPAFTGQTVVFNQPAYVEIYVIDAVSGCGGSDTIQIEAAPGRPEITFEETGGSSCGALNITAQVAEGNAPYNYLWTDGTTTAENTLAPGTHCVSVTSADGCVSKNCIVVPEPAGLEVNLSLVQSASCEGTYLEADVSSAAGSVSYSWSTGISGEDVNFEFAQGHNTITVTDGSGCEAVASIFVDESPTLCGEVNVRLFNDSDADCSYGSGEQRLANFKAVLTYEDGTERLITTNVSGTSDYSWTRRLEPGDYSLTVIPPNDLWVPCIATQTFTLASGGVEVIDVPMQAAEFCTDLHVNVSTGELTWCAPNNPVSLRYENYGTVPATDAYIELQLEEFLTISESDLPFTDLGGDLYRFDIGTVDVNERAYLNLKIGIDCEAEFGATHCLEAVIFPNEPCTMVGGWSGASIDIVDAECDAGELVFRVENVGTAAMTTDLEYVIIEDAVMFMQAPQSLPPLQPGEQHEIAVPANGATWRLETNQEPNHPGFSAPSLAIEGCNFYGSTGFINQFPQNDEDPFIDIECVQSTGSYDPNDKQGFPLGLGDARIIAPGQPLEYRIRFQNTGTDTAELVVIRDTLSELLDPLSLQVGAASHDYRLESYGRGLNYLAFIFEDINLLDSNLNEPASHGYIDFKIWPKENLPLGTEIYNTAAIYFDYNPPIITNTTRHRIDSLFTTATEWLSPKPYELQITPNPVTDEALLRVVGLPSGKKLDWQLLDATGRPVWSQRSSNGQAVLRRNTLPAGLYFLRVSQEGQLVGNGKLIIR